MIILFLHDEKTEINYAPQSFSSLLFAQRTVSALSEGIVNWEETKIGWFLFDEFSDPDKAIGSRISVQSREAFLAEEDPENVPRNLRAVEGAKGDV